MAMQVDGGARRTRAPLSRRLAGHDRACLLDQEVFQVAPEMCLREYRLTP